MTTTEQLNSNVPIGLEPLVDAAKGYLLATLAWTAAGEKLATSLQVRSVFHFCFHSREAVALMAILCIFLCF